MMLQPDNRDKTQQNTLSLIHNQNCYTPGNERLDSLLPVHILLDEDYNLTNVLF
jgi:hypothetical protein